MEQLVRIEGHILKRKQCSIPILGKPQSRHGVHQPRIENLSIAKEMWPSKTNKNILPLLIRQL